MNVSDTDRICAVARVAGTKKKPAGGVEVAEDAGDEVLEENDDPELPEQESLFEE
jgi:hypothetical protein